MQSCMRVCACESKLHTRTVGVCVCVCLAVCVPSMITHLLCVYTIADDGLIGVCRRSGPHSHLRGAAVCGEQAHMLGFHE